MYVCAQTKLAIVCLCRMGRAMLMPIFKQIRKATSEIDEELEKALRWWLTVLREDICEIRSILFFIFAFQTITVYILMLTCRRWVESEQKPLQLLCDARSTPPRVAAVLVVDGRIEYSDFEPSKEVMRQFTRRGDNQIASLELLSIAFGFSNFARELRGGVCIGSMLIKLVCAHF